MGTVALSASNYVVEPASSAVITVYRSGSASGTASVGYSTINGSAVSGEDYSATSGTLSWSDGDTSAKTVLVPVTSSASGKSFAISLTSIEGSASFGNPASALIDVLTPGQSKPTSGTGSSGSSSGGTTGSSTSSSSGTTSSSSGTTSSSSGTTSSSSGTTSSSSGTAGSSSSGGSSSSSGSGTNSITISWQAPTDNTNGSPISSLAGYNIYYGSTSNTMTNKISIKTVGVQDYVIGELASGTWYFALTAVNTAGVESVASNTVETSL